jgi:hypothetical protein
VIFREDGLRGFYRGCATNLLRTTPAAALTFTSFELIARALRKLAGEQAVHVRVLRGRGVVWCFLLLSVFCCEGDGVVCMCWQIAALCDGG